MKQALEEAQQRWSQALLRRPWVPTVAVASFGLSIASSTPRLDLEYGTAPAWVSVVALLFVGYAVAVAPFYPRIVKQAPHNVFSSMCAFALAAVGVGFVAMFLGSPRWVLWVAFPAALTSVAASTRLAMRSSKDEAVREII